MSWPLLKELNFDGVKLTKTMNVEAGKTFRKGVRDFLIGLSPSTIPVDTGMAKAALAPIGRAMQTVWEVSPKRAPYFSKLEGVVASVSTGESASRYVIQDDKSNGGNLEFSFEFDPGVKHFWQNKHWNKKHGESGEDRIKAAESRFQTTVRNSLETSANKRDLGKYLQFTG
jgi:hypothetical protein